MRRSRYSLVSDIAINDRRLLMHGVTGALDEVSNTVAAFIKDTSLSFEDGVRQYEISEETLKILQQRGYITEFSEPEERRNVGKFINKLHSLKLSIGVSYMIVITYLCNLRCHYCFQKPLIEDGGMYNHKEVITEEQVDAAFAAMGHLRPKKETAYNIELFGGEPLLARNRPIIEYIVNKARADNYTLSATSNAVDINEYEDLLGPGFIKELQITLDGPASIHDKIRIFASGKGTFDKISDNVSMALDKGVQINLRINIAKYNVSQLPEVIEHIKNKKWDTYSTFSAGLAEVHYLGIQEDTSNELSRLELIEKVAELNAPIFTKASLLRGIFSRHFDIHPGHAPRPRFNTCFCNAMKGHYIFDPKGDVYTCTEDAGFERSRVGTYYPDGLKFMPQRLKTWQDRTVANLPDCPNCEYLQMCGGGCARHAVIETGDFWTSYCSDFKEYFQKVLTLLYQDMKSNSDLQVLKLDTVETASSSCNR